MITEYSFRGKKYQFNTEASLKMGKAKFIEAHKGVPNLNIVWDLIEANQPKQSEKKPK
jgi:hypothetical protein